MFTHFPVDKTSSVFTVNIFNEILTCVDYKSTPFIKEKKNERKSLIMTPFPHLHSALNSLHFAYLNY